MSDSTRKCPRVAVGALLKIMGSSGSSALPSIFDSDNSYDDNSQHLYN